MAAKKKVEDGQQVAQAIAADQLKDKAAQEQVDADMAEIKGKKEDDIAYNYPDIIRESLLRTGRDGMVDLIDYMDQIGFFKAPCSTRFHLAKEGGLAEHSVNVMWQAEKISLALIGGKNLTNEFRNSLVIASLLHDLGKCGDYGKPMYVDKVLKSGKKGVQPYETNKALTHVPHAVRSIKLATLFIDLTEEEEWAILTHDGLYDFMKYDIPGNETQMSMILHWADMWASHVIEVSDESDAEE